MQQRPLTVRARMLLFSMVVYLILFSYISYVAGNREFLYYAFVMFVLFLFIMSYYSRLRLSNVLLVGIATHGILHFLGGIVFLNGVRLYDVWLTDVFKYDNIVHTFGVFLLTFMAYNLLRPHFTLRNRAGLAHFSFLLFLVVMGVGAVSEIVELIAVRWLGAAVTVGDYFNNAYDLVYNAIGSILACGWIAWYEMKHLRKK